MGKQEHRKQFHLKLPTFMLTETLHPTGCRNSAEAEATWRLEAAVVAVRVLRPKGVLPIFKDISNCREGPQTEQMHISLWEEDLQLLTEVSTQEGGSRGELVRKLILTTQRIVESCPGTLNHDGLVAEMITQFLPLSQVIPAEW